MPPEYVLQTGWNSALPVLSIYIFLYHEGLSPVFSFLHLHSDLFWQKDVHIYVLPEVMPYHYSPSLLHVLLLLSEGDCHFPMLFRKNTDHQFPGRYVWHVPTDHRSPKYIPLPHPREVSSTWYSEDLLHYPPDRLSGILQSTPPETDDS